ncbi:Metallo-dependent hydrolase [Violaceomyces palustris]|uniref:Metallo-dependent hydrolase n=1 Tax=Violaceomyces palustris TaxID=1673888 RepID=A0ACD0NRS8_9BASI|nr:Metallo-dependent hydrolase [Violaceomyces palustris]
METSTEDRDVYLSRLNELKDVESRMRYDHEKLSNLSPLEIRANSIVSRLRQVEIEKVWEREVDVEVRAGPGGSNEKRPDLDRFAGMDFHGAREAGLLKLTSATADAPSTGSGSDQAYDSRGIRPPSNDTTSDLALWNVITKLPKGALLHCHMDGTVDVRFLISKAITTPGMHMRSSEPLTSVEALHRAEVRFLVLPPSQYREDKMVVVKSQDGEEETRRSLIYDESYEPATWVPFNQARSTFPFPHPYISPSCPHAEELPSHLFPQNAFDAYIHSLMTLTPHDSVPTIKNSKQAWSKFISTFGVASGLLGYEPTLKEYVKEMLRSHAEDGIAYTEARVNFLEEFMVREDGRPDLCHREWIEIYERAVEEVRREYEIQGRSDRFWGSGIIYSTVRIVDSERLRWHVEDCLELKRLFPERIVGFDLVGHEDPGITLREYLPELLRFKRRQKELGIEIPFLFHAGETLSDGEGADENLYDAILLGTKRIGHGLSLTKHPHLTQLCKRLDICVEICPISNQLLGYSSSVASHPTLLPLLNQNVPVVLSSDDPAIFENHGLSYDFYQLLVSSRATTLSSLAVLARRSIRYSQVEEDRRERWYQSFDRSWNEFLEWLDLRYSSILDSS